MIPASFRSGGKPEAGVGLIGADPQGGTDVPGGDLLERGVDHPVKGTSLQGHPLVKDSLDMDLSLEQVREELLAGHRIVGGEVGRGGMAVGIHVEGDLVSGEHGIPGFEVRRKRLHSGADPSFVRPGIQRDHPLVVVWAFLGGRVGKEDAAGAKNWRASKWGGEYAKDDERPDMKPKSRKKALPTPPAPPVVRTVHFEYHDNDAESVCLAGSFNEWHPSSTPMVPMGYGRWAKEVELPPGVHEYLFVADGRWLADPGAAVTISNPFGGINCCVKVE